MSAHLVRIGALRVVLLALVALFVIKLARHFRDRRATEPPSVVAITQGDPSVVPENMLVVVKNPDGVKHGVHEYAFGDQCLAIAGTPLSAIAEDSDRVLVRQAKPPDWFYGVCVPGVVFFLPKETFLDANKLMTEARQKAEEERMLVERLLATEQKDPPISSGE